LKSAYGVGSPYDNMASSHPKRTPLSSKKPSTSQTKRDNTFKRYSLKSSTGTATIQNPFDRKQKSANIHKVMMNAKQANAQLRATSANMGATLRLSDQTSMNINILKKKNVNFHANSQANKVRYHQNAYQ